MNGLLESLLESDEPLINTGVLATSPAQFSSLWAIREGLTEAMSKEGKAYKYDISVPLHKFQEVIDATRQHLASKGLMHEGAVKHVVGYGHVGDGMYLKHCKEILLNKVPRQLAPECCGRGVHA